MNFNEMYDELKEIKQRIEKFEKKYTFIQNYKIICAILDKCKIYDIKLTADEVERNKSLYIVNAASNEFHVYKDMSCEANR